jgi:predicted permease
MDEFRLAIRRLTKRPGASCVSIVTLACAIGTVTATWSLLSAVLLHPLPVREADRVLVVGQMTTMGPRAGYSNDGLTYPYLPAIRNSGIFEEVAADWNPPMQVLIVAAPGLPPIRNTITFATWDFFDLLGVRVPIGRGFTTSDDRKGAPPVVILTDAYWRRAFEGHRDAIGRTIRIADKAATIVGVAQPDFAGQDLSLPVDAFLPFHVIADIGSPFMNYFAESGHVSSPTAGTRVVARLREGDSASRALSRLTALEVPAANGRPSIVLTPINQAAIPAVARGGMREFARLLGTTVGLLLLIGAGTVGLLLLIRTEARRDELAMCVALGASRARLGAGIVFEGVALSAAGVLLAVPVAWWLYKVTVAYQLPGGVSIERLQLGIDVRAVVAAGSAAVFTALFISLIAAAFGVTASVADALRSRAGSTPRVRRRRTRAALVITQVAVAVVLVTGAGLFARSLSAALSLNTGLDMARIVDTNINLMPYGYNAGRASGFFDDLRGRLAGDAAVASVAYSVDRGGMLGKLTIDGDRRQFPTMVGFVAVDDDYFRTLGIRVAAGRNFARTDAPGAPPVSIVSGSFARAIASGNRAIGKRIAMPFSRPGRPAEVMEIVGVVDDVVTRVSELQPLTMYFPLRQIDAGLSRNLTVRAASQGVAAEREILGAVKAIDPAVSPTQIFTLEERIARQMSAQQFGTMILGALGTIALLLTVFGAYVLGDSMAAVRTREMGIRAALGATGAQLGRLIVAETAQLVATGLLTGYGLAALGAGTIRTLLFQISPYDPVTLTSVAGVILAVTILVTLRPAVRAARVDLATVLREP